MSFSVLLNLRFLADRDDSALAVPESQTSQSLKADR
jgi:hypothetical protein